MPDRLITAHWVSPNGSGMHHMAEAMLLAERRLGHDAHLIDVDKPDTWASGPALSADVHINHTRFPIGHAQRITRLTGKVPKVVFVAHGIPEHVIELAATQATGTGMYESKDVWMLLRHCLKTSDATVVFTSRYQALYETMAPQCQPIDLVPMGVDLAFWDGGKEPGLQLEGDPAVFTCENQHRIKWSLDLLLAWPFVLRERPEAHLHAHFIPFDLHRIFVDLANTNGAGFGATITAKKFDHRTLRGLWNGAQFMMATTRYGDNTLLTMQAEAAGLPVISYAGNPYASHWIAEGDQRTMAAELLRIFDGTTPMRDKTPVPDVLDTGRAMVAIYERILA